MRIAGRLRHVTSLVLAGSLCSGLMAPWSGVGDVAAKQPGIERFTIADERGVQRGARIGSRYIVWEDGRRPATLTPTATPGLPVPRTDPTPTPAPPPPPDAGPFDVRAFALDSRADRRLTDSVSAWRPDVSGKLAVWVEQSAATGLDLVVYDIDGRDVVRRLEYPGDQDRPAISGRKIVWQEFVDGSWNVAGYDLDRRERFNVSSASGDQTSPAIDGDLVAFEDSRDSSIWYRDLTTGSLRRIEGVVGAEPAVSGDRIVFRTGTRDDAENANISIFEKSTGRVSAGLATTLEGRRGKPRMSGDLVVWWDTRHGGDGDIYGYDLGSNTEFRITASEGHQVDPDVFGNVVVWTHRRGGESSIRGARVVLFRPTSTPAVTSTPTMTPVVPTPVPPGGPAPRDGRYFGQTGYRIDNDRFWEYFNLRGGVKNIGFPVSRTFTLHGFATQMFQRHVMQLGPQGPRLMNLLDPGLMPYSQINTSTFPEFDGGLAAQAPQVGSPGYDRAIVEFVRQNAPDWFVGQPVNFYSTFVNQVDLATAFPGGGGNPNLLPLLNLELAGSVTSRPMVDPRNAGFIYQRFQRAILHFDTSCMCTQPILLGDWFKTMITGQGLPSDLDQQAQGSPFYRQYNNLSPTGLNRPELLPNSNLRFAFEPQ